MGTTYLFSAAKLQWSFQLNTFFGIRILIRPFITNDIALLQLAHSVNYRIQPASVSLERILK